MKKEFLYCALLDTFLGGANTYAAVRAYTEGRVGSAVVSAIVGAICFLFGFNLFIKKHNERNPRQ